MVFRNVKQKREEKKKKKHAQIPRIAEWVIALGS